MKNPPDVSRDILLKRIADHLVQVQQWAEIHSYDLANNYSLKSEALIELLEIADCGSIGGFDRDQPRALNIFDRFDWLCKKYGRTPSDFIKLNYKEMLKYFGQNNDSKSKRISCP